jgi:hypothetical protein
VIVDDASLRGLIDVYQVVLVLEIGEGVNVVLFGFCSGNALCYFLRERLFFLFFFLLLTSA